MKDIYVYNSSLEALFSFNDKTYLYLYMNKFLEI